MYRSLIGGLRSMDTVAGRNRFQVDVVVALSAKAGGCRSEGMERGCMLSISNPSVIMGSLILHTANEHLA
jgi:hypothetical protein